MSEAPEGHVGKTGLAPVASGFHKIVHMGFLIRIARLMSWINDSDQQHLARLKKSTQGSALNFSLGRGRHEAVELTFMCQPLLGVRPN